MVSTCERQNGTCFSESISCLHLLYPPIKAKNMSLVVCCCYCDASSAAAVAEYHFRPAWKKSRPKSPWAQVQRASTSPCPCRTESCIARYVTEMIRGPYDWFISASVVFQKSTWTLREHGALRLTARRCATLGRASQECRCRWSVRLATWRSAPLARRRGTHSACAQKTKLLWYQLSRGKRGSHRCCVIFWFVLARSARSVSNISFIELLPPVFLGASLLLSTSAGVP